MTWLRTLRKSVLNMTQGALADEIHTTQTTVSRGEQQVCSDILPSDVFVHLQDLVLAQTGRSLPAQWYFTPPSHEVLLSYFGLTLSPEEVVVTGKAGACFPAVPKGGHTQGGPLETTT